MKFEKVSQTCQDQLSVGGNWTLELMGEITPVREYMRRHGGIPDGFDDLVGDLVSLSSSTSSDDDVEARLVQLGNRLKKMIPAAANTFESNLVRTANQKGIGVPGWRNDDCTMDWHQYACYCYHAAGATNLNAFLDGDAPTVCPPEVANDTFYDNPPGPKDETSWWPWVAGAAALLGVGWLFTRKG
jgi:hypothetical protein